MPKRIQKLCNGQGCNTPHRNGSGYCDAHASLASWGGRDDATNGNRHKRGYGNEWVKLRAQILQRDKCLCQPCLRVDRVTQAVAVDHIKPKAQGGMDAESNLQAICKACHTAKTTREKNRGEGRCESLQL